jgi:4-amino-4-deoxy-L-arabinose transferase-like glycosyltransferase
MNDNRDLTKPPETQPSITQNDARKPTRLELAFWLLAIVLGFAHIWSDHHYLMNADALSYIDIADAYLRKDWHAAVNSYWSPLYSWLIAAGFAIAKPSPYWKFAVVHLVNFGMYLFALGSFCFLMREMLHQQRSQRAEHVAHGLVTLPDWALLALGYSLFIWSSLFLVSLRLESPDMLVAAFVYLATGMLLRIRRQCKGWPRRATPTNATKSSSWVSFVLLGIILGLGFLAKSVMFLLTPVFLIAAMMAVCNLRRALPRVIVAVVLFVIVAGPFIYAMSQSKGSFTTGRSGRLNYLWAINRVRNSHWQGEEPNSGTPKHPTRKIFDNPPAFEFSEPVGGPYPVWYDPTYWYEGSVSHFDFVQQVRVFGRAIADYLELLQNRGVNYALLIGLLALYILSGRGRLLVYDLIDQWMLIIPALAGLGLYALVNVQGRYVASFLILLWLALFMAARVHNTPNALRFARSISIALIAAIVITTVASSYREIGRTLRQVIKGESPVAHEQWQVAEGLRELGVAPSDKVAFIGDSYRVFWAYLLGVRVTADVRRDSVIDFWQASPKVKGDVIKAFAGTGVKAVVTEEPPVGMDLSGWKKIRDTNYYVYLLNR